MAILKFDEIKKMDEKERKAKIQELTLELIKRQAATNKQSKVKIKEIKKTIARLLMLKK